MTIGINEKSCRKCFYEAGYTDLETNAFLNSGIVAIDLTNLPLESKLTFCKSEPINLFSLDFNPAVYSPKSLKNKEIILLDLLTGGMWTPFKLDALNIYGHGEYHWENELLDFEITHHGRSRFWKFPYYYVNSAHDLVQFCNKITETFVTKNQIPIFFRGQTHDYIINRQNPIKHLLYNDINVHETSLPSNAHRWQYNYHKDESYLRMVISDIDYRLTGDRASMWYVDNSWEFINVEGIGIHASNAIECTMAIGQHYGIPTFGLDVSESFEIAWWFATHPHLLINDKMHINSFSWGGKTEADYPVIYILRSAHFMDLQRLGYRAERPKAQKAYFISGSWGTHSNSCADDIVAAVKLGPNVGIPDHNICNIYPSPDLDPMYYELLKLKKSSLTCNHMSFLKYIFDIAY